MVEAARVFIDGGTKAWTGVGELACISDSAEIDTCVFGILRVCGLLRDKVSATGVIIALIEFELPVQFARDKIRVGNVRIDFALSRGFAHYIPFTKTAGEIGRTVV